MTVKPRPRWRAARPAEPAAPTQPASDDDRAARAFEQVYPLLVSHLPTAEILRRYRAEIRADR